MITVVAKCKNEEKNIASMLTSIIDFADSVVIVDDFSTDRTAEIAISFGAKIIQAIPHDGQIDLLDKQGFKEVEHGWILRMDADERLTPELAKELKRLQNLDFHDGVKFARSNILFGKALRYGGWFESNRMGFFKTSSWDRSWDCKMHSQVPVNGEIYEISKYDAFMVHEDYSSVGQFIERTLLRYSATESEERKVDIRFMQIFTKPLKKFLGKYFIRKGYKDGIHGLIIAILLSIYEILIILQVWDKKRRDSK
jgi:(heptosyl)LPS beta-1,4-glucosyltransferase